jgi:hypothetical protein
MPSLLAGGVGKPGGAGDGGVPKKPGRPKGAKDAKPRTRRSKQEIAEQRTAEAAGLTVDRKSLPPGMVLGGYPNLNPSAFDSRGINWTTDPRNSMGGHMGPPAWDGGPGGYPPGMAAHMQHPMGGVYPPHGHPQFWPGHLHQGWAPHGGGHMAMMPGMQGDQMPWGQQMGGVGMPGGPPAPPPGGQVEDAQRKGVRGRGRSGVAAANVAAGGNANGVAGGAGEGQVAADPYN